MSNSIAMPRCRGSASSMPSGRTIVGSGRLRRFVGCAAFLPLPFLAPPAFAFGRRVELRVVALALERVGQHVPRGADARDLVAVRLQLRFGDALLLACG